MRHGLVGFLRRTSFSTGKNDSHFYEIFFQRDLGRGHRRGAAATPAATGRGSPTSQALRRSGGLGGAQAAAQAAGRRCTVSVRAPHTPPITVYEPIKGTLPLFRFGDSFSLSTFNTSKIASDARSTSVLFVFQLSRLTYHDFALARSTLTAPAHSGMHSPARRLSCRPRTCP